MEERKEWVVVYRKRTGQLRPEQASSQVVEARNGPEAVRVVMEGEDWQVQDGVYGVHVIALDQLDTMTANRTTAIEVDVKQIEATI